MYKQRGKAFVGELLNAFFQLLAFHGVDVDEFLENFWREAGDAFEHEAFAFGEGIANFEVAGIVQAHYIAGVGIFHHFFRLGQEEVGVGEFHLFFEPNVFEVFVAFKLAGANPEEGDAIAVFGVEVGVNFENETGEFGFVGFDIALCGGTWQGVGGYFDEGIEEFLYPETIECGAEENGCGFGAEVVFAGEFAVYAIDQFYIVAQFGGVFGIEDGIDLGVCESVDIDHVIGHFGFAAFEQVEGLVVEQVNAFEIFSAVDGPAHGVHADVEFAFEFFEEVERVFAIAVHFVHENDHGGVAHSADFHEFFGLFLYAFHAIHHEDYAVYRGECAIGVFGEIFVSGRIEDVDPFVFVMERHYRCGHGDTSLFFNFHEIGGGGFGDFVAFYGACGLDLTAEEEEFLCEGGFTGIWVSDDGEGFAFCDFGFKHER